MSLKQVYEISKSLHAVCIYKSDLFWNCEFNNAETNTKHTDMSKPSVSSEHYTFSSALLHLCSTCMPCAGDRRALMKCSVSQGAKSPISTCLFWSLEGTGRTFQSGSLLMCLVLSRKLGRSPVRSSWAFLDTLSCRIWRENHPDSNKSFVYSQRGFFGCPTSSTSSSNVEISSCRKWRESVVKRVAHSFSRPKGEGHSSILHTVDKKVCIQHHSKRPWDPPPA